MQWILNKRRKYLKQQQIIEEYARIISEFLHISIDDERIQDAALALYIKEYGSPIIIDP